MLSRKQRRPTVLPQTVSYDGAAIMVAAVSNSLSSMRPHRGVTHTWIDGLIMAAELAYASGAAA